MTTDLYKIYIVARSQRNGAPPLFADYRQSQLRTHTLHTTQDTEHLDQKRKLSTKPIKDTHTHYTGHRSQGHRTQGSKAQSIDKAN